MIVVLIFNLLLLATSGYAIWKGGKPEQWAGAALLIAAGLTMIIQLPNVRYFQDLETAVMLVDVALLGALVTLALKANRYWPIWITAIHASAVAIHFAKLANPGLVWPLYAFAASVSSIPIQLILLWATLRHQHRIRTSGIDPPWSEF